MNQATRGIDLIACVEDFGSVNILPNRSQHNSLVFHLLNECVHRALNL